MPLEYVSAEFGFHQVKEEPKTITLQGENQIWELTKRSRIAKLNGLQYWLLEGTRESKKGVAVHEVDWTHALLPLLKPYEGLYTKEVKRIVIDPGHGGKDQGGAAHDLEEKELTLDIARRLKTKLINKGYEVVLTREDDTYVSLTNRAHIATKEKADFFISLHFNTSSNPDVKGIETYLLTIPGYRSTNDPHDDQPDNTDYPGNAHNAANFTLAYEVQKALLQSSQFNDRGIRRARFAVLREATCPAVLVELGFLTHPKEASYIAQPDFRAYLAQRLCNGLHAYANKVVYARLFEPIEKE